jgi:hypothetical protein
MNGLTPALAPVAATLAGAVVYRDPRGWLWAR